MLTAENEHPQEELSEPFSLKESLLSSRKIKQDKYTKKKGKPQKRRGNPLPIPMTMGTNYSNWKLLISLPAVGLKSRDSLSPFFWSFLELFLHSCAFSHSRGYGLGLMALYQQSASERVNDILSTSTSTSLAN